MIEFLIFAALVASWVGYHCGYATGYKDGAGDELDKVAQRHERMKRFGGSY